jgi:vitamin B12 transporter
MMHLRLLRTLFNLTFFILTPLSLRAQSPDTVLLSPIVVTATRYPIPAASAAATITVLSGDALRSQGIATVADALRLVPGAAVVATGSFGGQTSLFLRGGESDYVKVLIDGVPQNQPGGFFDFANLGTEDVERIEIVRGPVSVLYGSDAVTGVVHIITRSGGDHLAARVGFGGGGYGTEWGDASLSGGGATIQFAVSGAHRTTSGIYEFNNDYRRELASGQLRLRPDARTQASLIARYNEGVFHFPTDFIGVPSDSDQHTSARGPSVGLELSRSVSSRIDLHVSGAYHREESRYDDGQDSPGDTTAFCCFHSRDVVRRLVLGGRADVRLAGSTIVTGGVDIERQRQWGTTLDTARHNAAVYVQARVGSGRPVSITIGGRVDDNQQFGRHATGRIGLAWRPDVLTRAHVSAGTGFKEPSFFENFASGFARGNPGLKPEQSTSWEVGVSRITANGRVLVSATYFDQRFRDLIQYSPVPVGADSVNYVNVDDATARGLEVGTTIAVTSIVSVGGDYALLHSRDRATGARLQRRPGYTASARVGIRFAPGGRFDVTARFTGSRADQDFATFPVTAVTLPGYTVVDASAEYRIPMARRGFPGLTVRGQIANLLDARYEEVRHFRTPRRALFLGARLDVGS